MPIDFQKAISAPLGDISLGLSSNVAGLAVANNSSLALTNTKDSSCKEPSALEECLFFVFPELSIIATLCANAENRENNLTNLSLPILDSFHLVMSEVMDIIAAIDPLGSLLGAAGNALGNVLSMLTGVLNIASNLLTPFLDCLQAIAGDFFSDAFNSIKDFTAEVGSVLSGKTKGLSLGVALEGLLEFGAKTLAVIALGISEVVSELFNIRSLRDILCSVLNKTSSRLLNTASESSPFSFNGVNL